MDDRGLRFLIDKPGVVSVDAVGADGRRRRVCDLSAFLRLSDKDAELSWSESEVELGRGAAAISGVGAGLSVDLELTAHQDVIWVKLLFKSLGSRSIHALGLDVDFMPDGKPLPPRVRPDVLHVPHLLPEEDMVMGDMIFRSPALIAGHGHMAAALVPDLERLAKERTAPWAMDYDRHGPGGTPRMSLLMTNYLPFRHVYFMSEREKSITIPEAGARLDAQVIVSADEGEGLARRVLAFLWDRYGHAGYLGVRPQVMGLDDLAREAMGRLFKRDDLYFEFEYKGEKRAGVAAHAATSKKPLKPVSPAAARVVVPFHGLTIHAYLWAMNRFGFSRGGDDFLRRTLHERGIPFIRESWFTSWFNNLRTAYGARVLADRWGDARMAEQAGLIKSLALSAPDEGGVFSSVCSLIGDRATWKRGTLTFMPIDDYHLPDQCTTGCLMLRWHRDVEPDPALMEKARGLGRFIRKVQLPSGAVPAWVKGRTLRPLPRLMESASTAAPMMFMAMLALEDKDEQALTSARRMAGFIEREVLPEHKWFDYETFYSCSKQRRPPRCPRTEAFPQNTMSMWWAAEGARLLYAATGEDRFKELLLQCLDDLLFHQQVWDPPYLSINAFGGFGSMNTDGEWNDARQGAIAPVLMDSYLAVGDPSLFERGVAALRACYTTMLHPALKEVAPGNMVHYRESDRGAVYENYAHIGIDRVIAGYLEPDWGAGTAAFATAHARKFFGDLFVDLEGGHAFAINGCAVTSFQTEGGQVRVEVEKVIDGMADPEVVVRGAGPQTKLFVNGKESDFRRT